MAAPTLCPWPVEWNRLPRLPFAFLGAGTRLLLCACLEGWRLESLSYDSTSLAQYSGPVRSNSHLLLMNDEFMK